MGLRNRGGKWHWQYLLDGRGYSGPTELRATERNKTAAIAEMESHRKAIKEGRRPTRDLLARRFSEAVKEYCGHRDAEDREHPATALRIAVSLRSAVAFFGPKTMVASLGPREVEKFKAHRITECEVRDVTLRHDLHALSGFFQWCIRINYARENPVRSVRIPSDAEAVRIHVLSATEEKSYLAAALDSALADIAQLMLEQGCRPDELLCLRAEHIDLVRGTLRIVRGKTKAAKRTLTLTPTSRSILARRADAAAKHSGWIFPAERHRKRKDGKPSSAHLSASGLAKKHAVALEASKTAFVPYDLRHTFATRMAQGGCDLATLAAILGHASLRLVQRYVHPTAAHQAEAMRRYGAARAAEDATLPVQEVQ